MTLKVITKNTALTVITIVTLVIAAGFIRFNHLGYHEFQDDEKKALIRLEENQSTFEFFMQQRKGPIQWFVAQIPLLITDNPRNEFAQRFPFTLANLLSVLVFYFFIHKITKNKVAAFFSAMLFSVSGFMVGFSRISQYQSLNLFFSLLSLYFYFDMVGKKKNLLRSGILGTLFFCLSLLSHWDAVFILPAIVYFFVLYLKRTDVDKKEKKLFVLKNIFMGLLILLPFLIPYTYNQLGIQKNVNYFNTRVGLSDYTFLEHKFIFDLYNPFFAFEIYITILLISLFFIKKNHWVFAWFILNLLLIRVFMAKPGTHIYNYLIPIMVISGIAINELMKKSKKLLFKVPVIAIMLLSISVLYYQSYMIFVDHSKEYPWDGKAIFNKEIDEYYHKEVLTFGFPHFRNWKEVNKLVAADPDNCSYISNEGKEISQFYMDTKYGVIKNRKCYYIVVIKRPFISTRQNTNFAQVVGKSPIYKYNKGEETLTKVYKVRNKNYKD
jgi:hypothetical protein